MESKPLVTCHGDQALFSSLHSTVLHGLPKEPAEWKRSYGRPSKMVNLEASFVPYDVDILPDENEKTLISLPFFHIYWTDCDLETYRQSVREDITEWQNGLKSHNNSDWLIVVVINDENKVKSKILPRASVIDRVRNDFCSKHQDRCVILSEPMKSDQKSTESWGSFYQKLRLLLLQAFNHHLSRYEENMRALRERRYERGWSFNDYFLVQEELAFMFEMLGLYEDALIQYDEMDILFTQSVQSHTTAEPLEWLAPYCQPCLSWAGLTLRKAIDWDKRDMLKIGKPTVLELRNYLFSRQCAILFLLHRPWEVAIRASEFLSITLQEVKSLNVSMLNGSLDCWGFLSCLEILQVCERHSSMSSNESFARYTAILWDYSREKLRSLGIICGLMPGFCTHPTSEQLILVINLTSGMGILDEEVKTDQPRPLDRLREALSSEESFRRIFLELSELTMGTFKHVGRYRSSRMIGRDLAKFYMQLKQPQKAESFLLDALRGFLKEKWDFLSDSTHLELAKCYSMMGNQVRYVRAACHIASSRVLKLADREFYMNEIKRISENKSDTVVKLPAHPFFTVSSLDIGSCPILLKDPMKITLLVESHFVGDILFDAVTLTLCDCSSEFRMDLGGSTKKFARQVSDSKLFSDQTYLNNVPATASNMIDIQAHVEGKPGRLSSSSLVCVNSNEVLKRIDSSGNETLNDTVCESDENSPYMLSLTSIQLLPGKTSLTFEIDADKQGFFKVSQLNLKFQELEFHGSILTDNCIEVVSVEPSFEMLNSDADKQFLSGICQELNLEFSAGSMKFRDDEKMYFKVITPGLQILTNMGNGNVDTATFSAGDANIKLKLFQEPFVDGQEKIQAEFAVESSAFDSAIVKSVTFHHPFSVSQKLYTSKEKKYIQIMVVGNTNTVFVFKNPLLEAVDSKDVELLPLIQPQDSYELMKSQTLSFVWQMKSNIPDSPAVNMVFTMNYICSEDLEKLDRQLSFNFGIYNYQTLLTVSVHMEKKEEHKVLKTGVPCTMHLEVRRTASTHSELEKNFAYEVQSETQGWAFTSKTSGRFVMEDVFQTEVKVTPLAAGYLPLPKVKIFRCVPTDTSQREESHTDLDEMLKESETVKTQGERGDKLVEFSRGQVYYSSLGKQVSIFPETSTSDVEVIVV